MPHLLSHQLNDILTAIESGQAPQLISKFPSRYYEIIQKAGEIIRVMECDIINSKIQNSGSHPRHTTERMAQSLLAWHAMSDFFDGLWGEEPFTTDLDPFDEF